MQKLNYSLDNRIEFSLKIVSLRQKPTTYNQIAKVMNEDGYRNRNGHFITAQFVGNVLNRHGKDAEKQLKKGVPPPRFLGEVTLRDDLTVTKRKPRSTPKAAKKVAKKTVKKTPKKKVAKKTLAKKKVQKKAQKRQK